MKSKKIVDISVALGVKVPIQFRVDESAFANQLGEFESVASDVMQLLGDYYMKTLENTQHKVAQIVTEEI